MRRAYRPSARTMSDAERFTSPHPEELDAARREVYDAIVNGPRAAETSRTPTTDADGALLGPFATMLLAPGTGMAVQRLGGAIRFAGTLSAAAREAAILAVAAAERSDFEWFAHEQAAVAAGVAPDDVAAIRGGGEPADPALAAVCRATRALHADGALDDAAFAETVDAVGREGLAELVWLTGYYAMLATSLRVFDPPVPPAARGIFAD